MNLEQLQVNYLREEELRTISGGILDWVPDCIIIYELLQAVKREALIERALNSIFIYY